MVFSLNAHTWNGQNKFCSFKQKAFNTLKRQVVRVLTLTASELQVELGYAGEACDQI